jgi:diketogulonate reductase-like aldo/keto reductase
MPRIGLGTGFLNNAKQIEHAISEVGYRKIDTASIMQNEKQVGKGIRAALDSGKVEREDLFVTAKLWHSSYEDPDEALEKSLEKLGLDYVDLYYVHWPNTLFNKAKIPMHELWASMEALMYSGQVRSLGVSNFNLTMTADLLTYAHFKPVVN